MTDQNGSGGPRRDPRSVVQSPPGAKIHKRHISSGGRARSRVTTDPGLSPELAQAAREALAPPRPSPPKPRKGPAAPALPFVPDEPAASDSEDGDDEDRAVIDEPSTGGRARSKVRTALGIARDWENKPAPENDDAPDAVAEGFAERLGASKDTRAFGRQTAMLNVDELWRDSLRETSDADSAGWEDEGPLSDSLEQREPLLEDDIPQEDEDDAEPPPRPLATPSAAPQSTAAASIERRPGDAERAALEGRGTVIGVGLALLAVAFLVAVTRLSGDEKAPAESGTPSASSGLPARTSAAPGVPPHLTASTSATASATVAPVLAPPRHTPPVQTRPFRPTAPAARPKPRPTYVPGGI